MRILLLAGMMIFTTANALAAPNRNPWMRTCRIEAGQFWVLKAGSQEYTMCFFGEAAIGAEALFLFKTNAGIVDAVSAYKSRNASSARGGVCGSYDAEVVQGRDSEGHTFNLCRFADKSLIEETTLWMGPGSSPALDRALSSPY